MFQPTAAPSGPTRDDRRSALLVDPDARFVTRLIISRSAAKAMTVGIQYTHPLIDRLNAAINTSITYRPTKTSTYVYTLSDASPEAKLPHTSDKVEKAHLTMMLDTGSSINVIDERTFATLRPTPKLQSVNVKIMAYGSSKSISHLGRFEATFESKHRICVDTVYVVRGNHGCLLRYSTALQLGLIETINQVSDDEICQRYPSLFNGSVGVLKDYSVKLHIDNSVRPTVQPHPVSCEEKSGRQTTRTRKR